VAKAVAKAVAKEVAKAAASAAAVEWMLIVLFVGGTC
jgi:hypothetical protein